MKGGFRETIGSSYLTSSVHRWGNGGPERRNDQPEGTQTTITVDSQPIGIRCHRPVSQMRLRKGRGYLLEAITVSAAATTLIPPRRKLSLWEQRCQSADKLPKEDWRGWGRPISEPGSYSEAA